MGSVAGSAVLVHNGRDVFIESNLLRIRQRILRIHGRPDIVRGAALRKAE
jgi:hypothetical protein